MATQNPISTISYNTEPFLKEKLDALIDAHIIQAYQYIKHKGEEGDKDHIHLRIEPNKRIDQMEISDTLKEYVNGEEKPRGVRPWRPSKEEDFFLYVVHDKDYLDMKYADQTTEKIPYDYTEIQVSEGYDLESAWVRAKQALKHLAPAVLKQVMSGESAHELVLKGESINTVMNAIRLITMEGETVPREEYRKAKEYIRELLGVIDELKEENKTLKEEIERLKSPWEK